MKGMKIHIKQLKPDLPLSSLSTNLINFNSYKHQSVLRIEERIELSYPPNEKKHKVWIHDRLAIAKPWAKPWTRSRRHVRFKDRIERWSTVDCKNALFSRVVENEWYVTRCVLWPAHNGHEAWFRFARIVAHTWPQVASLLEKSAFVIGEGGHVCTAPIRGRVWSASISGKMHSQILRRTRK